MDEAPPPLLFDHERGIHIAPIRHHSPACAFHLRAMIAELEPAAILIEAPGDHGPLIPLLTHEETRPPVAIVTILDREGAEKGAPAAVSYFPFCAHSPEYVALKEAAVRGIEARFIDLPSTAKSMF